MSTKKSEATSAKTAPLDKQYREIGPAAIAAALICSTKKTATGKLAKKAA